MRVIAAWVVLLWATASAFPAAARMFYVPGAGEVPIAVSDTGKADGPEILFIHGLGQGLISFRPQLESALAERYHLVAFDLRGHAASGKPFAETAYTDPAIWAEDVRRVMDATGLKRPIVVAWSYGTLVISDYIRSEGSDRLAGVVMVGALGQIVHNPAPSGPMPPALIKSRELQQSLDLRDQEEAARAVVGVLTAGHPVAGWNEMAVHLETLVPPYVLPLLRKHMTKPNDDLVPRLTMPILVMHGAHDQGEPQAAVDAFLQVVPTARASRFDTSGHSPFAEDPERFNRELATFVDAHWPPAKAPAKNRRRK